MNTITIHSEKPDDIYFIRELVNRLGLQSEIKEDEDYVGIGRMQPSYGIPESEMPHIIDGMKEVRAHQRGEIELGTLDETIEELRDER